MKPLTRGRFHRLRRGAPEKSVEAPGYKAMARLGAPTEKVRSTPQPQEVWRAIGEINSAASRKEAATRMSFQFTSQPTGLIKTDGLLWMAPHIFARGNRRTRGAWADVIEERLATAEMFFGPKTAQGHRIMEMQDMVAEKVQEMLKERVITKIGLRMLSTGRPHLRKVLSKIER